MALCWLTYGMKFSQNSNDKTSFDDLPHVLVVHILLRVPVKTLIQSTCVCKLWLSIIKTSYFVSSYLSCSISQPSSYYIYLFGRNSNSPLVAVISDNNHLTRHLDFKFPFETKSILLELIGVCNGLICMMDSSDSDIFSNDIYLINPFIHKYKKLDVNSSSCYVDWIRKFHADNIVMKVGFGYSDVENDYKVVRIFNRYSEVRRAMGITSDYHRLPILESKVEIYGLKSKKWRALDISIEIPCSPALPFPVSMHGCLYWSMYILPGSDNKYILCFDMEDEVISRIDLPTNYLQSGRRFNELMIRNDTLVTVVFDDKRICLFVLVKNFRGNIEWKEFYYECSSFDGICTGFSSVGRLLFRELKYNTCTDTIIAVDLDNCCALEKFLVVDFKGIIDGATNVFETLALLLD